VVPKVGVEIQTREAKSQKGLRPGGPTRELQIFNVAPVYPCLSLPQVFEKRVGCWY